MDPRTKLLYRALVRGIAKVDEKWVEQAESSLRPKLLRAELGYLVRQRFEFKWKTKRGEKFVEEFQKGIKLVHYLENDPKAAINLLNDERHYEFVRQEWRHQDLQPPPRQKQPVVNNTDHLLRRWFKHEQQNGGLPIPQKLPYVERTGDLMNPFQGIPDSTKSKLLRQAYDYDYVEGIIKPGLAYDINKYHYLNKLDDIVNRRGPHIPKITFNDAAPAKIAYIPMPFPQIKQGRDLAMLIKKWTLAERVKQIWNLKETLQEENRMRSGGYHIKKVNAYNDVLFTRLWYEQWSLDEASWESWLEDRPIETVEEEWLEPLEIATNAVNKEVADIYKNRPTIETLKPALDKLVAQQKQHYDKLVATYQQIGDDINHNPNVFKHGELVNSDRLPLNQGKQLGDYLQPYQLFHWGDTFFDRFVFDKSRDPNRKIENVRESS